MLFRSDLPGFEVAAWIGVMVSAGTPKPLVEKLAAAVDKTLQAQDVREKLSSVGLETDYRNAADMARLLKEQSARFSDIIKKANIKLD